MKRTFLFSDDNSSKFWTIEVNGNSYTVNYGKTGTAGQTQSKDFADDAACKKAADKLIAEKTKKGYIEQGDAPVIQQNPSQTAKPKDTEKKKSPATKADEIPEIKEYYRYDTEQSRAFLKAIRGGKLSLVKQYLAAGANPAHRIEAKKNHKVIPIIEALLSKHYDVLKELIACSNSYPTGIGRDEEPMSVLVNMAINEDLEETRVQLVSILIENGYDVAKDSRSILTYYSRMKLPDEMLKMLLEKVNLKEDKGDYLYYNIESAYRWANDTNIDIEKRVIELIDFGVQINPSADTDKYMVKDHGSVMHTALTFHGSAYKLIKKLIDGGADLSIKNTKQIIVTGDATRNTPQKYTPLQLAQSGTIKVSDEVLELLKQHSPADPNEEVLKSGSPEKKLLTLSMISPQEKNHENEIRELIKQGVDVNAVDHEGKTALHHLVVHDWYNVLLALLPDFIKAGANVSVRDKEGRTPIFYIQTPMRGIGQLYQALISAGADINARDNIGNTPAIFTVSQVEDRELIIDILKTHLACGADPNITTNDGNALLHHYMANFDDDDEFDEFLDYLIKKGIDINAKNKQGQTSLHIAATRDNRYAEDIVQELIAHGADIKIQDNDGNTALHLATDDDVVEEILAGLPDINIKNNAGITAADSVKSKKFDSSKIDSALEALSKAPAAERELLELKWTEHAIDISDDAPMKIEIVSAILIPESRRNKLIHYIGDNMIAVCGDDKDGLEKITVIDTLSGQILWEKKRYDGYCNECPPLIDGDILYMPRRDNGASSLFACNRRTGEELWTCKTGNSYGQYKKWIKQSNKYIVNINYDTKKLYIIDKAKGKMKMAKLSHPVREDSKNDVTSWNDKIIVVGVDKKKDRFVLDVYDPVKAEFIETISELGDYSPIGYHTEGKYMYVLTSSAHIAKVNLETGQTESEKEIIAGYKEWDAYIRSYNDTLELRKDGKLHFRVSISNGPEYYCTYDLATDVLHSTTVQGSDKDVSPVSTADDIYTNYDNGLVSNTVTLNYGAGDKKITECPMPNYGGNSRIIKAEIVGNAVYVLQQGGNTYGEKNSILYRLQ